MTNNIAPIATLIADAFIDIDDLEPTEFDDLAIIAAIDECRNDDLPSLIADFDADIDADEMRSMINHPAARQILISTIRSIINFRLAA